MNDGDLHFDTNFGSVRLMVVGREIESLQRISEGNRRRKDVREARAIILKMERAICDLHEVVFTLVQARHIAIRVKP